MSLSDQQWEFLKALAQLIQWAEEKGFKLTISCARCVDPTHHKQGSYHYSGLAADLNLFIDGDYMTSTRAHLPLGEKWESLGGTWGGRFSSPDGNHYSWGEAR